MTKKQFRGLVDNLANVCTFNTSNAFSLSLEETQYKEFYHANLWFLLCILAESFAPATSSYYSLWLLPLTSISILKPSTVSPLLNFSKL